MKIVVGRSNKDHSFYPFVIGSDEYPKLFAVQSSPVEKYFLKGKEIKLNDLIKKLESLDY